MEYKTDYTEEELNELFDWFETHKFENQINLGKGINVVDVKLYVQSSINQIKSHPNNVTFSGLMYKLFIMKDELIKQGKVLD